jgi:hypothetical protein
VVGGPDALALILTLPLRRLATLGPYAQLADARAFEEVQKFPRGHDPDALVSAEREKILVPGRDISACALTAHAMIMSSFVSLWTTWTTEDL